MTPGYTVPTHRNSGLGCAACFYARRGARPGVRLRTKLLSVSVYRRQRQRPRPTSTSARRTRRQAQAWQAAPELQSEARKALTAVRNCISRDCQVNTPADRGGCGCRDREAACAQHFSEYVPGRYLHRGRLQIVAISSADDGVQFRGQKQSTGDNPRRRFISSVE